MLMLNQAHLEEPPVRPTVADTGPGPNPLPRLLTGENLPDDDSEHLFERLLGTLEPKIAGVLSALRIKAETSDEIIGALRGLFAAVLPFERPDYLFADCCGAGGDGSGLIDVSTAVAFVASACGLSVARWLLGKNVRQSRMQEKQQLRGFMFPRSLDGLSDQLYRSVAAECGATHSGLVCVIDDDQEVRSSLGSLLRSAGYAARTLSSPTEFLESSGDAECLILDAQWKDANGLDFQEELLASEAAVPVVFTSGHSDIRTAVQAMKAGAVNFLTKPFQDWEMVMAVQEAVDRGRGQRAVAKEMASLRARYETLSRRQQEVMGLVTAGLLNKQIGARLGVQEITVKIHRGQVMHKMNAPSLPDLVRMAETLGARETSASRYARPV
jgi:FixJ family two-component response regulator